MTAPQVKSADRKAMALGALIARGGEGEVYAVNGNADLVAKIYTGGRAVQREPKVKAIIDAGLGKDATMVAYPTAVLLDQGNRFAGFLMRKVAQAKPLFQLYKPIARKQHFPNADFRFLTHVALNIAKAMASVHQSGCIVGDVNESGFLVSEKGTVSLIDADSFQFEWKGRRFVCEVGKPEYTAPELQNRPLREVVRQRGHDAFALAVLIFQLLWMGRHPFSGVYSGKGEMPLEKAISERRFAYSLIRATGMTPPPGALKLDQFPAYIGTLFERAFGDAERPEAEEWVSALTQLRRDLRPCPAAASHYYPAQASTCPWCAIGRQHGTELFPPPPLPVGKAPTAADWTGDFDIAVIWQSIERVTPPPNPQVLSFGTGLVVPSAQAQSAKTARWKPKVWGWLGIMAAIAIFSYFPSYWVAWLGVGLASVGALFDKNDDSRFIRVFETVDQEYAKAAAAWLQAAGDARFKAAKAKLLDAKRQYESLADEEKRRLDAAQQDRRNRRLHSWLENFQISKASIKGIGTSRAATLASFGIETAAEVELGRLLRIPGFGPRNSQPLLDWRRRLESKFRYDPRPDQSDLQREAAIRSQIAARARALKDELQAGPANLAKVAKETLSAQQSPPGELVAIWKRRQQAEADLRHLGMPIPTARSPIATSASGAGLSTPVATGQTVRQASMPSPRPQNQANAPVCPRCSSPMIRRTARRGRNAGGQFWGCSRYPICKATKA